MLSTLSNFRIYVLDFYLSSIAEFVDTSSAQSSGHQARRQEFAAGVPKSTRGAHLKNKILDICSIRGQNIKF